MCERSLAFRPTNNQERKYREYIGGKGIRRRRRKKKKTKGRVFFSFSFTAARGIIEEKPARAFASEEAGRQASERPGKKKKKSGGGGVEGKKRRR